MKKYAQLEYSFTDAEIDPKSREALKSNLTICHNIGIKECHGIIGK